MESEKNDVAASVHAVVTMQFVEDQFPPSVAESIRQTGGKPIKSMGYAHQGKAVYVMLCEEPSGHNGAMERHASISASYRGVRQWPSIEDIEQACLAVGMPIDPQIAKGQGMVIHAYAPLSS